LVIYFSNLLPESQQIDQNLYRRSAVSGEAVYLMMIAGAHRLVCQPAGKEEEKRLKARFLKKNWQVHLVGSRKKPRS
jgi:hypothetical protein